MVERLDSADGAAARTALICVARAPPCSLVPASRGLCRSAAPVLAAISPVGAVGGRGISAPACRSGPPQPHEARWGRRHRPGLPASDLRDGHAGLFDRAFFINSDGATERRSFMERQLELSGVPFERWPALRGSPSMLETHASYLERGVERHLHVNRSNTTPINGWGTVGTYLSHHTLFEHLVERYEHDDNASVLILQDDTELRAGWLQQLRNELTGLPADWERVLLVWWGLARESDCGPRWCVVRPPAGPTDQQRRRVLQQALLSRAAGVARARAQPALCAAAAAASEDQEHRRAHRDVNCAPVCAPAAREPADRDAPRPRVGSERAEVNAAWRVRSARTRRGGRQRSRRAQGPPPAAGPRLAGKRAAPQPASQQCLVVPAARSGSPTCSPGAGRHCGRWCKCQACEYCST